MNNNATLKNLIELLAKALTSFFGDFAKPKKTPTTNIPQPQVIPPSLPLIIEEVSEVEIVSDAPVVPVEPVEEERESIKWHIPTHQDHFHTPSQSYLQEDWELYGKFGHHTGVDYGGRKKTGLPLFACADGELIYREVADSAWGKFLGHHAALYVPSVGKSFLYCHMAVEPRALGSVQRGEQIGVMGNTGKSAGGAIHLHLEGFHGRFEIAWRSFQSLEDIKNKTFDAHEFIRSRLV